VEEERNSDMEQQWHHQECIIALLVPGKPLAPDGSLVGKADKSRSDTRFGACIMNEARPVWWSMAWFVFSSKRLVVARAVEDVSKPIVACKHAIWYPNLILTFILLCQLLL